MSKRFVTRVAGCLGLFIAAGNAQAAYMLQPLSTFGGGDGYLSPGEAAFITTDSTQRGLAYNPANDHLYVVNRSGGLSFPILDGSTGASVGSLSTTNVTGGTFAANMIRVAHDGAIYAANLTTASAATGAAALKIYRWANEAATPTVVYSGDAGLAGVRFGDTLDVRGSGNNTQILMGQGGNAAGSTNFAVFSTTDGNTFTPQIFNTAGVANGDFRLGVAFGQGNTIYAKQPGQANLRLINFDPAAGTATLTATNTTVPTSLTGIDYDPTLDLIGGAFTGNTTTPGSHDARLFEELSFNDLVQVSEMDFPTNNANSNGASSTAIGNGRMYVLITNNGIGAYSIVIPEPASVGLLALGGLTLLARRRR